MAGVSGLLIYAQIRLLLAKSKEHLQSEEIAMMYLGGALLVVYIYQAFQYRRVDAVDTAEN